MHRWLGLSAEDEVKAFSQYRLNYRQRRELSLAKVAHADLNSWQRAVLASAGVCIFEIIGILLEFIVDVIASFAKLKLNRCIYDVIVGGA